MTTKSNLVLFGGGFLSHNIAKFFQDDYNLILFCRKYVDRGIIYNKIFAGLDLRKELDYGHVDYDIIDSDGGDIFINCASAGTRRKDWNNKDVFIDNILMYVNFMKLVKYHSFLNEATIINFGSGAEFIESGYYGMSKKAILSLTKTGNWLRLYGVFGEYESRGRFIRTCFERIKQNKDIVVDNKQFDFYSMYDLCNFIVNIATFQPIHKCEFECVYTKPIELFDIAKYIGSLYPDKDINIICKDNFDNNYISSRKYEMPTSFRRVSELGLFESLKKLKEEYYNKFE